MAKMNDQARESIINKLKRLPANERAQLLGELKNVCAQEEELRAKPFPKRIVLHIHEDEENLFEEARVLGIPANESWNPVYETALVVEVQEDYSTKIIACNGFMIDYNKPFNDVTVKVG